MSAVILSYSILYKSILRLYIIPEQQGQTFYCSYCLNTCMLSYQNYALQLFYVHMYIKLMGKDTENKLQLSEICMTILYNFFFSPGCVKIPIENASPCFWEHTCITYGNIDKIEKISHWCEIS